MTVVVDTNVILIANRQHADVSDGCVASCSKQLQQVMVDGQIAIDDGHRILQEYGRKTSARHGKGAGDVFVKWVLNNRANPCRCSQIRIMEHPKRGFDSFPEDPRLNAFDPPDRKFVAVARAHPKKPRILQAADSKWLDWEPTLREHGVVVEFVCPDDITRFAEKKRSRRVRRP